MSVALSTAREESRLEECDTPLALDDLVPGSGLWEVEIGFGKGRYLLRRASEDSAQRFLGIEVASAYYRLALKRACRSALDNVLLVRGEALYLMSAVLPKKFASAVHVYFPDPWPKARHQKRRLFDPETVDLVLGLLGPGGRLLFATDHLEYGESVRAILDGHPAVDLTVHDDVWADGARTNYEAKYIAERRPILRFEVTCAGNDLGELIHPGGELGLVAATAPHSDS